MDKFYSQIIEFYDSITDQKPERWVKLIKDYSKKHRIRTILDIGCGTGTLAKMLAEAGYIVTGIDASEVMLRKARVKIKNSNLKNLDFRKGNMADFSLKEKFDVITCSDAINHILEKSELAKCFASCHKHLAKGGAFIFNTQTEEYVRELEESLGYGGFVDGKAFIWQDYLIDDKHLLEFIVFEKLENGLYKKQNENLIQAVYSKKEVLELLKIAGFRRIKVLNENLKKSKSADFENIFIAEK